MKTIILILILFSAKVSIAQSIDSCSLLKRKLDTANHNLYMANKQLNDVKFYIKICQKNPANRKFFYGWITNRAIKSKPR